MKDRINFALGNVAFSLMAATFFASAAFAQSATTISRRSPIQLEAAVVNNEPEATRATFTTAKTPSGTSRPRAKPPKTSPRTAPALRLETREAARQVIRNDQSARLGLTSVGRAVDGEKISPQVMQNLRESAAPPRVEMGDRPARSQSLCGDGKNRRFAELDSKTVAALLPEFNALRPRTVCARRGVLIADYAFK